MHIYFLSSYYRQPFPTIPQLQLDRRVPSPVKCIYPRTCVITDTNSSHIWQLYRALYRQSVRKKEKKNTIVAPLSIRRERVNCSKSYYRVCVEGCANSALFSVYTYRQCVEVFSTHHVHSCYLWSCTASFVSEPRALLPVSAKVCLFVSVFAAQKQLRLCCARRQVLGGKQWKGVV